MKMAWLLVAAVFLSMRCTHVAQTDYVHSDEHNPATYPHSTPAGHYRYETTVEHPKRLEIIQESCAGDVVDSAAEDPLRGTNQAEIGIAKTIGGDAQPYTRYTCIEQDP